METSNTKVNTEALLKKVPELLTETTIKWELEGSGPDFEALCELLKDNAIPMTELNMSCDTIKKKKIDETCEM